MARKKKANISTLSLENRIFLNLCETNVGLMNEYLLSGKVNLHEKIEDTDLLNYCLSEYPTDNLLKYILNRNENYKINSCINLSNYNDSLIIKFMEKYKENYVLSEKELKEILKEKNLKTIKALSESGINFTQYNIIPVMEVAQDKQKAKYFIDNKILSFHNASFLNSLIRSTHCDYIQYIAENIENIIKESHNIDYIVNPDKFNTLFSFENIEKINGDYANPLRKLIFNNKRHEKYYTSELVKEIINSRDELFSDIIIDIIHDMMNIISPEKKSLLINELIKDYDAFDYVFHLKGAINDQEYREVIKELINDIKEKAVSVYCNKPMLPVFIENIINENKNGDLNKEVSQLVDSMLTKTKYPLRKLPVLQNFEPGTLCEKLIVNFMDSLNIDKITKKMLTGILKDMVKYKKVKNEEEFIKKASTENSLFLNVMTIMDNYFPESLACNEVIKSYYEKMLLSANIGSITKKELSSRL